MRRLAIGRLLLLGWLLTGCLDARADIPEISNPVPRSFDRALRTTFAKHIQLLAPSGQPIHLFAQEGVSDAQLRRAWRIMRFYLTDAPGTTHGSRKSAVANMMARRQAALFYFDTEAQAQRALHGKLGDLEMHGQDLYATESPVEGSPAWLENTTRDAAYEEIFHLVHGAGIIPALPAYQRVIASATRHAMRRKLWIASPEWIREGSTTHEYMISVIDVHYGLWAHDPDRDGSSFGGEYLLNTRAMLKRKDPQGYKALRQFLPDRLDHPVELAASFEGTFSLRHDKRLAYTRKSRYLQHVTLTGKQAANLVGNDRNNGLTGNDADNRLTGGGGDDMLVGGKGTDTAVFRGPRSEYRLIRRKTWLAIEDRIRGRDGTDRLSGIEILRFTDGAVEAQNVK